MKFKEGDVIVTHYVWTDREGVRQSKKRPAVVARVESNTEQLVVKCTSKNRSNHLPGRWILKNSTEGELMGIKEDTFVSFSETIIIEERYAKYIGHCPFIEEIIDFIEN